MDSIHVLLLCDMASEFAFGKQGLHHWPKRSIGFIFLLIAGGAGGIRFERAVGMDHGAGGLFERTEYSGRGAGKDRSAEDARFGTSWPRDRTIVDIRGDLEPEVGFSAPAHGAEFAGGHGALLERVEALAEIKERGFEDRF